MSLTRVYTAGTPTKAAAALFDQLDKALKSEGEELVQKTKVGAAVCVANMQPVWLPRSQQHRACPEHRRHMIVHSGIVFHVYASLQASALACHPQQHEACSSMRQSAYSVAVFYRNSRLKFFA
jgi:hypothetical protein